MTRMTVLCLLFFAAAIPAHLSAATESVDPIQAELTAFKVTLDEEGEEALVTAEIAEPGDLLEYRANYLNQSEGHLEGFSPVMPVPTGLEFVPQSEGGVAELASVDGKTFSPIPLTYEVQLPDGTTEVREVPLVEYRFLKWNPVRLSAGTSLLVSARMRVSDIDAR